LKRVPFLARAGATIRAYIQEREAGYWISYYRREVSRRNLASLDEQGASVALHQRMAERGGGRWPKQKGKLHIFLAYSANNWESILPFSLKPFGNVTVFEWRGRGFDDAAPDWLTKRDQMNIGMLETFHAANRDNPVDAVVGYLSGYNTSPETLQAMAGAGAAIFNFCWDDKLNFPGKLVGGRYPTPAALAHVVDLNLTNAPDSVAKYAVHGGLAIFWPEAAHPDIHRPYDVPFDIDVSFVGGCYGWRPGFISRLGRMGIHVECFGQGWPNGPVSDKEMVRIFSRSRIILGFAGVGHSRKLMCLKGRDFEVPMSGGLYLTQHNPELALVYRIGKEIVTYRDETDCADRIKFLLTNPRIVEEIRAAGRLRCITEHTYEARWGKVFSLAGIIERS